MHLVFHSSLSIMQTTYQIKRSHTLWHRSHYTINDGEKICYQISKSDLEKHRSFEDVNKQVLYHIGKKTLQSMNGQILAEIASNGKSIRTIHGNYFLTDIDLAQGNYTFKLHDQIIAQVQKKRLFTGERTTIELVNINEQQLEFLFALLILIDSYYQTIRNPLYYLPVPYRPL